MEMKSIVIPFERGIFTIHDLLRRLSHVLIPAYSTSLHFHRLWTLLPLLHPFPLLFSLLKRPRPHSPSNSGKARVLKTSTP